MTGSWQYKSLPSEFGRDIDFHSIHLAFLLPVYHISFPDFSILYFYVSCWNFSGRSYRLSWTFQELLSFVQNPFFQTLLGFQISGLNFWSQASLWGMYRSSFLTRRCRSHFTLLIVYLLIQELLPFVQICFLDFLCQAFRNKVPDWKLVASFSMRSYRSSLTWVMIALLFQELLPFLQNLFCVLLLSMLSDKRMRFGGKLSNVWLHIMFKFCQVWLRFS